MQDSQDHYVIDIRQGRGEVSVKKPRPNAAWQRCLSAVLFLSLLFGSVRFAYAGDEVAAEESPEPVSEPVAEVENVEAVPTETPAEEPVVADEAAPEEVTAAEPIIIEEATTTPVEITEEAVTVATTTATADEPIELSIDGGETDDQSTSTEEAIAENEDESTEKTTVEEMALATTTESEIVPTEDVAPAYSFNQADCSELTDGTFVCQRNSNAVVDNPATGRVYAARDADGDQEIFLDDGHSLIKLTDNRVDDIAPVRDALTGRTVWQSLVSDRFQIMLYDENSREYEQLTFSDSNNTEPYVEGTIVVWQGWVRDNWEIFTLDLADGREPLQITDNDLPDMSPRAYEGVIAWQTKQAGQWSVYVYDPKSERIDRVGGPDDFSLENPRFALLVDKRAADGETEKVALDVETGGEFPLATNEREPVRPEELPSPANNEQTGIIVTASTTIAKSELDDDDAE